MAKFIAPATGELRTHVLIEKPTRTSDGAGGYTNGWSTFADPWTRFESWKGSEPYTQDQPNTSQFWTMTMRYRPGVTADMRVNDTALGVIYNIRSVQDPDRRKRWLYLLLESLKQQSS